MQLEFYRYRRIAGIDSIVVHSLHDQTEVTAARVAQDDNSIIVADLTAAIHTPLARTGKLPKARLGVVIAGPRLVGRHSVGLGQLKAFKIGDN